MYVARGKVFLIIIMVIFCLFFPDVGLRVNLSSCPTFADLAISLWKTLQLARNHGHFPFSTIAEEVSKCCAKAILN